MNDKDKKKVIEYLNKHRYREKEFFGLSFDCPEACSIASKLRVNGNTIASYYQNGEFICFYVEGEPLYLFGK